MKLWVTQDTLKQKEFLFDFFTTGQAWDVSHSDIKRITTRKEFVEVHVHNAESPLRVTQRVLNYPTRVVFALASIYDQYTSDRMLNFLARKTLILEDSFNPHILNKKTNEILGYLFYQFYWFELAGLTPLVGLNNEQMRKALGQNCHPAVQERTIKDYIEMALQRARYPNLRIKSYKRLVAEHDRLAQEINDENIPVFTIKDPGILPSTSNGYYFEFIGTKEKLVTESQEMHHCVASYADEIIDGSSIIYSISGKERATAEFCDAGQGYRLEQVTSYRNKVVSEELTCLLKELTSNCKLSAPILLNSIFPPSNRNTNED